MLRHFSHSSYQAMRAHLESYDMTGYAVQVYSAVGVEPIYDPEGRPRPEIFGISH